MVRIATVGALGAIALAFASPAFAQQGQERIINLDSLYADPVIVEPSDAGAEGADQTFTDQTFAGETLWGEATTAPAKTGQMFPDEQYTGPDATWSRVEDSKVYLNPSGPALIGQDAPPLGSEDATGTSFWGIQSIF
jgi:hypothetical protein